MLLKTILTSMVFASGLAMADIETVDVPKDMALSTQADGWHHMFSGDLGLNLTDMQNVAGKKDGLNSTYNIGLKYNANLYDGPSEWRNMVAITEVLSKSPSFEDTIHSSDELRIESLYLFNLVNFPRVSPYASFVGTTNMFKAYDYQQTPKVYATNSGEVLSSATSRFQLLEGFGIVNLQETVGALAKIITKADYQLEGRLGVGAKQIFADDQLNIDSDTDVGVVVGELSDVNTIGVEAGLEMNGVVMKSRIDYNLYAKAFAPLDISSDNDDLEDFDKGDAISTELGARLNFKLVEWASIVYEWKHLREPLIVERSQITQNLLLNVGYKFDSRAEAN